jgi:AraC family transcriptional regulator
MGSALFEPRTAFLRLDESSTMTTYREDDRFSIIGVDVAAPLPAAVRKSSNVPALLVSMSVRPVAVRNYRLWIASKIVPTGPIDAFRVNVIDLAAEPAIWAGGGVRYVHFHVRHAAINDAAADLGYEPVGGFRHSVAREDIVLAQITNSLLPYLGARSGRRGPRSGATRPAPNA